MRAHLLAMMSVLGTGGMCAAAADPMRPSYVKPVNAVARARAGSPWRVQAIIGDGRRRVAIVNGRLVETGDELGRYQVVRIGADRVELRHGRKRHVARLPSTPIS